MMDEHKYNQSDFTDKLLFDYYMISSISEHEVHCQIPFYIDRVHFEGLGRCGEVIDRLSHKILNGINGEHKRLLDYMDKFPYMDRIFSLKNNIVPVFWTRYDGFIKDDGGIFFSEFNYDKPCAQREILVSDMLNPGNNPNVNFKKDFCNTLDSIIRNNTKYNGRISLAVLVDPCHYEEHHLAHLYMDILKNMNIDVCIAGPKNFSVKSGEVFAFGKKIDVILRQYPTEYLYEVNDFEKILDLFDRGRVHIINDPRVIAIQAKSLFAYLWELVEYHPEKLSDEEISAIRESIPHTGIFDKRLIGQLTENKDKYVVKAVFGRYSEEVYIGALHDDKEWAETLNYVVESPKLHIIQEFCPIRKETAYCVDNGCDVPVEAYANIGIYMTGGKFDGSMIRWSYDYLTTDCDTWITPVGIRDVGIRDSSFNIINPCTSLRHENWSRVNDRAIMEYDFTGGYSCDSEYISLQSLILDNNTFEELKYASENICSILRKTRDVVIDNDELFFPIMGIDKRLTRVIKQNYTDSLCCIGRMDWLIDTSGKLKYLEFNAETPAGMVESIGINRIIKEELNIKYKDPNCELSRLFKEHFKKIVEQYSNAVDIKNIGFLTGTYYEDWYNTKILFDIVKDMPYNFVMGNMYDARVVDGKLNMYGKPLDAVYRYCPLDWYLLDEDLKGMIDTFNSGTLSINPPSTIVIQDKAVYAVIYELLNQGFYSSDERKIIKKYIPFTSLSEDNMGMMNYVRKPFLDREGNGVEFNFSLKETAFEDYIYQQMVYGQYVTLDRYYATGMKKEIRFPVIGIFMVDDSYAGIYTRAGGLVTDMDSLYLPTYIK